MDNRFVRDLVEYHRRAQRVFATDQFEYSGVKKNSLVLVFGGGEKGGGLRAAKVLSFWIGAIGNIEGRIMRFYSIWP